VPFVYLYLIIPYSLPQKNQELNLRSLLKLVVQVTESLSNVRQKVVNRVCFSRLIIQVCLHLRLLHKSCAFFKVVFSQSFFVVLSYISIKCTNIKILANKDSIIKSAGKCLNPSFHYKSRWQRVSSVQSFVHNNWMSSSSIPAQMPGKCIILDPACFLSHLFQFTIYKSNCQLTLYNLNCWKCQYINV